MTILIADDHPIIRQVLKNIINKLAHFKSFTDETASVEELIGMIRHRRYDLVILDINLEDGVSLMELPLIKMKQPDAKILFFSVCPEDMYAQRLIQMGAHGFVNKKATENEISEAISKVLDGKRYLSADLLRALLVNQERGKTAESNPFLLLSTGEFEILTLMLHGKTNEEISDQINVSASSVAAYKARIFEKLQVHNDFELSQLAGNYGITLR